MRAYEICWRAHNLMSTPSLLALARWWRFTLERFPPLAYGPMVVVFVAANASISGTDVFFWRLASSQALRLSAILALVLSYFFRLRAFDEIKDYEVDLRENPERPLARGLLTIPEVKRTIYALTLFELGIASLMGPVALATHGIAVAYSYLMYKEFFIGTWLRPHLTTYAVTHTASSFLLGWSVVAQCSGSGPWQLQISVLAFAMTNWGLFNIFEFARKSFAKSEERDNVESYSKLFGTFGAAALTLSQVGIALGGLYFAERLNAANQWVFIFTSAGFSAVALLYGVVDRVLFAKLYRASAGIYILSTLVGVAGIGV